MSLFRRAGRQVGQFTRTAKDVAEENAGYECRACDARFHTQHDQCPKCESGDVASTTTEE